MAQNKKGRVYLLGSGPGDPGLLTIKGREVLGRADVVIYDYLANQVFLAYANESADLIYVGKKAGCHTMGQEDINRLIVEKARSGLTVVRLKGGDPFIFGRGGEEAQELVKAGVSFEIIPGITSAISVPAYAGIPLTHRDFTSTVAFVTGHEDPTKEKSNIAWDKLATGVGTLVFLMGVGNLSNIATKLIEHGRSPDTPIAVIYRGTVPGQKTLVGTLGNIAGKVKNGGMKPPAIILVGEIVALREELNWFENRPLFGKKIVVTRAREQASGFLAALTDLGAECIEFPTIEVVPPKSWSDLDGAIHSLGNYQWLLFTSVNGVKYFFKRLEALGKDVRELKGVKVGAIGPKTAEAVKQKGIRPDLVPSEYWAEAVVKDLRERGVHEAKILLPRAAQAREILPDELQKMGAQVDVISAYETVMPARDTERVREMLEKGEIDMVTFTSSSTVNNFLEMFGTDAELLRTWMSSVAVACIGPITAETAREKGFPVTLSPSDFTIEALTHAIVDYFSPA